VPEDLPLAEEPGRLTVPEPGAAGHAWDTGMRRWDVLYGIVWLVGLQVTAATASPIAARVVATVAVAAMAPLYLLVGRPHMRSQGGTITWRAVAYMTGIVLLFAVADVQSPNAWFMAIAILPQCYHVLPSRWALIPVITMTAIAASSVGFHDRSRSGAITAAALAVAIIAFSLIYGGYISGIVAQSLERAGLIAQLEETRAELAEVSRQAGALAERQRLAGEIHDTLAQGFSSILMLIQAAQAQLDHAPATAHDQLALAAQTARENLADARTLVTGLAPAQLQGGTLTDALRRLTERSAAELGIRASFDASGPERPLPAATEVVMLRTGQEALANVRKHAAAAQVTVLLRYSGASVQLEVTDDGVGFDPAAVNGGYGLRGMRVRVAEAGGSVTVTSAPGQGTSVLAEVPA
jgi:signal transduction histidine kinase